MKTITKEEQLINVEPYTEVFTHFYCTRCGKRFKAKARVEEDGFFKRKETLLIDDRIVHFQTESEAFLFCSRCSRAFYSFLRI
jgi:hypothetical protein